MNSVFKFCIKNKKKQFAIEINNAKPYETLFIENSNIEELQKQEKILITQGHLCTRILENKHILFWCNKNECVKNKKYEPCNCKKYENIFKFCYYGKEYKKTLKILNHKS